MLIIFVLGLRAYACVRSYLAIASTLAQKLLTVDYGTRGPARSKLVLVGDGVVS